MRSPLSYARKLPPDIESLNNQPYEKILDYIKNNPHQFPKLLLYKYLGLEKKSDDFFSNYLLDTLFWLSSPRDFNDPFEMSPEIILESHSGTQRNVFNRVIKTKYPGITWKKRQKMISNIMANPEENLGAAKLSFKENFETTGVFCFSENDLNLLMWSHYADQHKGIVLQFDIAHDLKTFLPVTKVEYTDKYPTLDWNSFTMQELEVAYTRKHKGWAYEREWRLIEPDGAGTYLKFKPEVVTRLIFGCRSEMGFKKRILNILQERANKRLPAIDIYCAVIHDKKYELKIEKDTSLDWPS